MRENAPNMLPGSAADFALGFSIPKDKKLKDLVYQMQGGGNMKESDFRISLASENP